MIPQDTIERVREASDIVRVIGQYLRLKKRGRNYVALCPFHTEKTPSFSVNADKQIYHCFGCGKGGNVFRFLMEHEKMSFVEAVKFLAAKANITIRDDRSDRRDSGFDKLIFAHQVALEYYHHLLFETRYNSVLDLYLRKRRGVTDESVETFQLGLSSESWDGLIRHARAKGLNEKELEQAGLALRSQAKGTYFDRFRQRLMIPIFNLSNKPIAFGGRTLKKGEPAKYINSPETGLYHKSDVLFGLNLSRDAIRDTSTVFVVEGYFDVISLWQVGLHNVVASSGTAFTAQQARLLARFAESVYLFFDSDSAGQQAAIRSVDVLYDAGMEVKVMTAPAGEDPDSIARKEGRDKIEQLQQQAVGFIPFRVRHLDPSRLGVIGKERLVKEFSSLANRIGDPTRRALFIEEAATELRVTPSLLATARSSKHSENKINSVPSGDKVEFEFLSLLTNNPGTIDRVFQQIAPSDFQTPQLGRLYAAMITQYEMDGMLSANRLIEHFQDEESISLLTELAAIDWPKNVIDREITERTNDFVKRKQRNIRSLLQKELAEAEASGDQQKAQALLEQIRQYST